MNLEEYDELRRHIKDELGTLMEFYLNINIKGKDDKLHVKSI
jgi:hypothetical protein